MPTRGGFATVLHETSIGVRAGAQPAELRSGLDLQFSCAAVEVSYVDAALPSIGSRPGRIVRTRVFAYGGARVPKNWLRAAGWWASDYAYAVNRQARGLFAGIDPATMHKGDRAPVVVIPGIYESWTFLLPLITQVHERGHPIHVIEPLHLNLKPVVESASHVGEVLVQNDLSGAIILAHSKGGLIGKYEMTQPVGKERVRGMVAVATPFGGSVYARFMLTPSLRTFSPTDSTIRSLASEEDVNSRIVSIYGAFDPHIPAGSELAGAKNVMLDTGGHFRILADPRILTELDELADGRASREK